MNNINLVGRLVKSPEVKTVGDKTITSFRLAVDRKFGGKTDFFNCKAWNDNYLRQYANKGTMVSLNGEVHIDENEGRYYTTVVVDHVKIIADGKSRTVNETGMPQNGFDDFEEFNEVSEADVQDLFENH